MPAFSLWRRACRHPRAHRTAGETRPAGHSRPGGETRRPGNRRGILQITCTAVLWGTGGVIVRLLHDHAGLSPVTIAFYRLAVATPVLLLLATRCPGELRDGWRAAPVLLTVMGVGLGAYQALYFVAVADAGVSVATTISIGLAPVLITAWDAVRSRRPPTPSTVATLAVAACGLALVTMGATSATTASPEPVVGLLSALASGVGYAVTTVLSRRAAATIGPLPLTTITTAVGAGALVPLSAASGLGFRVGVAPVLELAYLGPMTTALAFALFYLGLRTTPAGTASMITLLEPLVAAALATAALGEPLRGGTVAGGVLLLGAVAALYMGAGP
ncbi:MAG: DMT family transporter [Acidimicrobiales bacterium]